MDQQKQEVLINQLINSQNKLDENLSKEEKRAILKARLHQKLNFKSIKRHNNKKKEEFQEKMQGNLMGQNNQMPINSTSEMSKEEKKREKRRRKKLRKKLASSNLNNVVKEVENESNKVDDKNKDCNDSESDYDSLEED